MLTSHVSQEGLVWFWDEKKAIVCQNNVALDFSEEFLKDTLITLLRLCEILRLEVMHQVYIL